MDSDKNEEDIRNIAIGVINKELEQASRLITHIDKDFTQACRDIVQCKGKVVVSGIGKSGHIGKKIAATLASTGTPSFFIHLAEALHGDLGMVGEDDLILLISNSGEASELKIMLPALKLKPIVVVAVTGDTHSYLARNSTHVLCIAADEEACPLGLAPSSSAVNTLVLGDALALTVMTIRGFNKHDFALSHPAGSLGNRLLLKVSQLVEETNQSAFCNTDTRLIDAISIMCQTGFGLIAVMEDSTIVGVFTDGDLRRALHTGHEMNTSMKQVMNTEFISVQEQDLCSSALDIMQEKSITALPVLNSSMAFCGVINLNSIHKAGIY